MAFAFRKYNLVVVFQSLVVACGGGTLGWGKWAVVGSLNK